jgi:hypothetical protein
MFSGISIYLILGGTFIALNIEVTKSSKDLSTPVPQLKIPEIFLFSKNQFIRDIQSST